MDDAQTLLSVSYIILLTLEGHFCPPAPTSSSVPDNNYRLILLITLIPFTVLIALSAIVYGLCLHIRRHRSRNVEQDYGLEMQSTEAESSSSDADHSVLYETGTTNTLYNCDTATFFHGGVLVPSLVRLGWRKILRYGLRGIISDKNDVFLSFC